MTINDAFDTIFGGLSRQGPGSAQSTRRALSLIPQPLGSGRVLDLGCGTGASTEVLLSVLKRPILASDVNPRSLGLLTARARAAGHGALIETVAGSMDAITVEPDSVALIWAEGSIFTVGVRKALDHWHPMLKSGGIVAFSELTWLVAAPPAEVLAYFREMYPPMTDIAGNLAIAEGAGYRLDALFVQPDSDWWDEYYAGIAARLDAHREGADSELAQVIARLDRELDIARRYGGTFGYVFYVLRRP